MADITVLYYTANREKPEFEQRIVEHLLDHLDQAKLDLISVSQQPMTNLGENICVGEVGVSRRNMFRQLLLGAEAARTEWVMTAEADCLYPPGYFDVQPDGQDCLMCAESWVLRERKPGFFAFGGVLDGLILARRDTLIQNVTKRLLGSPPGWGPGQCRRPFQPWDSGRIDSGLPVILFKTRQAMGPGGDVGEQAETLPYWGSAAELGARYFA